MMIDGTSARQIENQPKLVKVLESISDIEQDLRNDGWVKSDMGCSFRIDYNYRFDLYIRKRKLADVVDETHPQNTHILKMCVSAD